MVPLERPGRGHEAFVFYPLWRNKSIDNIRIHHYYCTIHTISPPQTYFEVANNHDAFYENNTGSAIPQEIDMVLWGQRHGVAASGEATILKLIIHLWIAPNVDLRTLVDE